MTSKKKTTPKQPKSRFLSLFGAKNCLGIGWKKIHKLVDSGIIPSRKYGTRYIIARDAIDAFLNSLETPQKTGEESE